MLFIQKNFLMKNHLITAIVIVTNNLLYLTIYIVHSIVKNYTSMNNNNRLFFETDKSIKKLLDYKLQICVTNKNQKFL